MTSGTQTTDNRIPFNRYSWNALGGATYLGTANKGSYKFRTHSGSDYPVAPARTWTDRYFRTPDGRWHKRRTYAAPPKRSRIEDHPYYMQISMYTDSEMRLNYYTGVDRHYDSSQNGSYKSMIGSSFTVTNGTWDGNDDIALLGKLREKVAGSDFNAGVFLGEGREALSMIANSAIQIRKALSAVKRLDLVAAARALRVSPKRYHGQKMTEKEISGRWLELQYGWLPLVNDAYGAAQFLAHHLSAPFVQSYKVRQRKVLVGYAPAWVENAKSYTFTGTVHGQLIARLTEKDVVGLVGLKDPASIAWELTPYSFVVDWFIPIGNYLAARSLAQSVKGSFVKTVTTRRKYSCTGIESGSWMTRVHTQPNYHEIFVRMDRTVSTTLSVPLPSFKTLDKVASWKRAANAISLLAQKLK